LMPWRTRLCKTIAKVEQPSYDAPCIAELLAMLPATADARAATR
jgi:hypothetical protein